MKKNPGTIYRLPGGRLQGRITLPNGSRVRLEPFELGITMRQARRLVKVAGKRAFAEGWSIVGRGPALVRTKAGEYVILRSNGLEPADPGAVHDGQRPDRRSIFCPTGRSGSQHRQHDAGMRNNNLALDLDGLLDALADKVAERLSATRPTAAGLVDLARVPIPKRRLYAAAKTGELKATKIGKRWLTRVEELARWIEATGAKPGNDEAAPAEPGALTLETMERELGLRGRPRRQGAGEARKDGQP